MSFLRIVFDNCTLPIHLTCRLVEIYREAGENSELHFQSSVSARYEMGGRSGKGGCSHEHASRLRRIFSVLALDHDDRHRGFDWVEFHLMILMAEGFECRGKRVLYFAID